MFKSSSFMVDKPYLVQVLQFVTFLLFKNQLIFRLTHQFLTCEKEKKNVRTGRFSDQQVGELLAEFWNIILMDCSCHFCHIKRRSERFLNDSLLIVKESLRQVFVNRFVRFTENIQLERTIRSRIKKCVICHETRCL